MTLRFFLFLDLSFQLFFFRRETSETKRIEADVNGV